MNNIPRPEYPRPQFKRSDWQNLNGAWSFETDCGRSGRDRKLYSPSAEFTKTINVPFCPESPLSGINNKDFMASVWYSRKLDIDSERLCNGKRTFLHIGACDYRTEVWVNGESVGVHIGGYTPIELEITSKLIAGENTVTICADDDLRSGRQPYGKQCYDYYSRGCSYTRTTGIWQTVWLETVPASFIKSARYTPDIDNSILYIEAECLNSEDMILKCEASFGGEIAGYADGAVHGGIARIYLKLDTLHLWNAGQPNLYDLKLTLGDDAVTSYFGMRSVSYSGGKILINGVPVFQRLILDQGFYPDGIYTAPTDSELEADVKRSLDMGFNGARLHQKIFEPRFLYYCDLHGYLVWGEHASWGLNIDGQNCYEGFVPEWLESLKRDYNHPAIVGWCPLNETHKGQNENFLRTLYNLTKAVDNTRPVIDTSGYVHVITDVVDCHDYDQNPETFKKRYEDSDPSLTFVSEYGGIWWAPEAPDAGWGYGDRPKSPEEFIARYKGLTEALLDNPKICAFCYTQLTNVEQEVNGLYTYDRKPKFDPAIIKEITSKPAAIEK